MKFAFAEGPLAGEKAETPRLRTQPVEMIEKPGFVAGAHGAYVDRGSVVQFLFRFVSRLVGRTTIHCATARIWNGGATRL